MDHGTMRCYSSWSHLLLYDDGDQQMFSRLQTLNHVPIALTYHLPQSTVIAVSVVVWYCVWP
jgi:hypothetical protein